MTEMTSEQMISVLYGATQDQLKQIEAHIAQLDKQREALAKTNQELLNSVKTLQKDAQAKINELVLEDVKLISKEAKKTVLDALNGALNDALSETQAISKNINKSLGNFGWRWLMLWLIGLMVGIGGYWGQFYVHSREYVNLQYEKAELEISVLQLKKINGSTKLSTCDDKTCVKVDDSKRFTNKKGEVFYLVK